MKNKEEEWLLREKYKGVESEAFHADRVRLAAGDPLGYVIGYVPFLDCTIWLDSRPLIPRPETEYWVEKAISTIRDLSPRQDLEQIQILDLCAGSGAIGVAVAKALPEAHVTFVEIDSTHLPTIEKNIKENISDNTERCTIIESDLFSKIQMPGVVNMFDEVRGVGEFLQEPYSKYGEKKIGSHNKEIRKHTHGGFDFILTNPPYIDANANTIDSDVKKHEPHLALFGGHKGMEVIERIIEGARAKLALPTPHTPQGGQLWIEHEPFQVDTITDLAHKHNFSCVTHLDQYKTYRYSVLTMA